VQSKINMGRQTRLNPSSAFSKPTAKYSFSLDSLVTQSERDDADEIGVAKAKSMIESSDNVRRGNTTGDGGKPNQALLSSVVTDSGDGSDIQRVINAMKRTEAFDQDQTWSFFDDGAFDKEDLDFTFVDDLDFPEETSEFRGWQRSLIGQLFLFCQRWSPSLIREDPDIRRRTFLSGFVAEKAASGKVADEILLWILNRGMP
jgi:hypothetical protein